MCPLCAIKQSEPLICSHELMLDTTADELAELELQAANFKETYSQLRRDGFKGDFGTHYAPCL
jgi:hypothetical protein